jgi:sulfur-oxidizing protein SoxY
MRGAARRARWSRPALWLRAAWVTVVALALALDAAWAQDKGAADSAAWNRIRASVFADAPIAPADDVITHDTPTRAENAAVVPVAIRARFPQSTARAIDRIWLIVDDNPGPVAAVFRFSMASGRADVETRIRIESYTWVRAVAQTRDGALYMAANYVKASGGCSAPAGADALAASASLGRMRLRVSDAAEAGQPSLVQLAVSDRKHSGLAMDQVTRLSAPAQFVRRVDVTYAGQPLLGADLDFAISENPNFRFYLLREGGGELEATAVDTQARTFRTQLHVDAASAVQGAQARPR